MAELAVVDDVRRPDGTDAPTEAPFTLEGAPAMLRVIAGQLREDDEHRLADLMVRLAGFTDGALEVRDTVVGGFGWHEVGRSLFKLVEPEHWPAVKGLQAMLPESAK